MRVRVNGRWFTEHAQWRADLPGWREREREREREKMQEGIDNKQGKGDQEMACCGAQKGQKVVDEAKKWHASIQECVMRKEKRKRQ